MKSVSTNLWTEEEYVSYLRSERRLYAWCLVRYGEMLKEDAACLADALYEYEASDDPSRGLVFHDEAWHWAMLKVFGDMYWVANPERLKPSVEYRAEALRIEGDLREL